MLLAKTERKLHENLDKSKGKQEETTTRNSKKIR